MITELRCTADALPCADTLDASDYAWEECTMKKGAAPISLAGSQLGNTRHVCAFFNSDDEEYRVLLPFIKDGRLRALVTTGSKRSGALPDVPTVGEAGFPGSEVDLWLGVFAPANLQAGALDRLALEMKKAIDDPKVREQINAQGVDPKSSTPAQFRQLFREEYSRWGAVIKKGNIKAD